jgi:hypothetical protein
VDTVNGYNAVYVGTTITLTAQMAGFDCSEQNFSVMCYIYSATEDITNMPLVYSYEDWAGDCYYTNSYYANTPGTYTIFATNSCNEAFPDSPLTVVQLTDTTIVRNPTNSVWENNYSSNPNRDYAAVKSPTNGDVVTFGLNINPNTPAAGSTITWSGATAVPGSNNLVATVPATAVTNTTVTASCTNSPTDSTTPVRTVWIFWGAITYNTNGNFNSKDLLSFTNANPNIPANATMAGFKSGRYTNLQGTARDLYAETDVEVIGTLKPSGVGAIVGNIFSFVPQTIGVESLTNNFQNSLPGGSTQGIRWNTNWDGPLAVYQQTCPTNDLIYMIDSPGLSIEADETPWYAAQAQNSTNYIYVNGGIASDPGYWYSHVKAGFITTNNTPTVIVFTNFANKGNPPLPTTWGGGSPPTQSNGAW